jgi:uncharacterized protein with ParB-like and HNH nuclease domain
MAAAQTIESQDLNLGKLFDDFYLVPNYQREYVWEDAQVEQLFSDVYAEFSTDGGDSEYFIGSIVVCPSSGGVLEVIDGQQRMTTAYLFLCVLRDHFQRLKADPIQPLAPQIAASDIDRDGNDIFRYRIDLQYEDSGEILNKIAQGTLNLDEIEETTRSIANIKNAYLVIDSFLQREFDSNINALRKFYSYFIKNVKLIRIRTQSVAHALKIFETINDRGKGLDSMDLLKNLMFMQASQEQFEKLKGKWKQLVDALYGANEKPLRFLRYFIFAEYGVDRLREDKIYEWLVENENKCGYRANPIAFVNELIEAVNAYVNFIEGKDAHGKPNRYLKNISYLSGAARQHVILLLAARRLSVEMFSELCRNVENLFFTFIITRENTREFERKFAQWTTQIRGIKDNGTFQSFLDERLKPAQGALSSRFELAFAGLSATSIQRYRMRYVLGKLTQYVDERAYGEASVGDLSIYMSKKVHVEHVLPESMNATVLLEFDRPEIANEYVQRLGNLTLAEDAINTSLGNKPYSEKRGVYTNSKFLLTKSISGKIKVGTKTAIDRAVSDLESFDTWTTSSISDRQAALTKLAFDVWEVSARS